MLMLFVYWVLAAIFLLIALMNRRLRPVGIVGCIVLGLMLSWGMLQRLRGQEPPPARGSPASPVVIVRPFPLDALSATQLRLSGGGAPFELRGHIANESHDMRLKSFTVEITRRDCHEGALDPSGCDLLWQGRQWVELALAPQQTRDFSNPFWARGEVQRVRGTTRDEIRIVAAEGEPAAVAP
jgi:hypothetical protein